MLDATSPHHPDMVQKAIMRWNWGAFLLTWIWAFGNRLWLWVLIGLGVNAIAFIPGAGNKPGLISLICQLVLAVILGVKGSEWAWKNGKWESIEQFKKTQNRWRRWGIVLTVVGFAIGVYLESIQR